jgi:serine hydrolase
LYKDILREKSDELKSEKFMERNILFIQGGGEGGYRADAKLPDSLKKELGDAYSVHYPEMRTEEKPDFGWAKQIDEQATAFKDKIILVGHSLGASLILKYLSENDVKKKISGVFLISTPFWSGNEEWVLGLKLKENFADKLPKNIQVFLYHCRDDEEIPFYHLELYSKRMPYAKIRKIDSGGHQLNNDLSLVAKDIKSL